MEDIIATYPQACGDKACTVQWHLRHVWMYSDGTYSECDQDGNHDDINADDVPSHEQVDAWWADYSRYVVETGTDPLREFMVKLETTRRETWRVQVRPSILGAVVTRAQWNGTDYDPRHLPAHVSEYLTTQPGRANMEGFQTWADFTEAFPKYAPGRWLPFKVDFKVARHPSVIARELRAAARRHLRRARAKA